MWEKKKPSFMFSSFANGKNCNFTWKVFLRKALLFQSYLCMSHKRQIKGTVKSFNVISRVKNRNSFYLTLPFHSILIAVSSTGQTPISKIFPDAQEQDLAKVKKVRMILQNSRDG